MGEARKRSSFLSRRAYVMSRKQELQSQSFALLNNRSSTALRLLKEHEFPCIEAPNGSISISCRPQNSHWTVPFEQPPLKIKEQDDVVRWEWTKSDEIRIDLLEPLDNISCDIAVWFAATQGSVFQDRHVHQLLSAPLVGLEIDWSHISEVGLTNICTISTISLLDLSWTQVPTTSLLNLSTLEHLKCVKLNAHRITPDIIAMLNTLPIEQLHLNQCRIQALSQLSLPSLKEIWLWDSNITDADLRFVEQCPNLERIEMRGCSVQGFRMQFLRSATKLRILNLAASSLTDNALSSLHDLPSLVYLDISHTRIERWAVELFKENRAGFDLPPITIMKTT